MAISILRGREKPTSYTREAQSFVLSPTETGHREVPQATSDQERAQLVGCSVDDLTDLPYGQGSRMWMSRQAQLDDDTLPNKSASHALHLHGVQVVVRGIVLIEHDARELPLRRGR